MTARKRGGRQRGGQPPAKGFRPGKEPTRLKKQRAKAQLGSDASWGQKQTMEAIAGRSPREVRTMVQRWSVGLIAAAVLLAVVGVFTLSWSAWVGGVAFVLSIVLLFLGLRLRKQGAGLVEMAESLQ